MSFEKKNFGYVYNLGYEFHVYQRIRSTKRGIFRISLGLKIEKNSLF